MKKIGFISVFDPEDKKASSGTNYKIAESLRKMGYELVWIKVNRNTLILKCLRKVCEIVKKFCGKEIMIYHTPLGAKLLSNTISKKEIEKCDLLLAPFSAPDIYGFDRLGKKIVYLSDSTFKVMIGYYFHDLSKKAILWGNKVEQRAIDLAKEVVVSSNWAYNSVVKDYGKSEANVHIIEFGANVDERDIVVEEKKRAGKLNILFLGVDWFRKGGDIAVAACEWLNDNGVPALLHVVGIKKLKKEIEQKEFVVNHGFLNKNVADQYHELVKIIKTCDCLLLPTQAECAGIAFAESSAYGLPSFSYRTGGVENYVREGVNGCLLPIGASGIDFGKKIKSKIDSGELDSMISSSIELYRKELNWNAWAKKMNIVLSRCV